MTASGRKIELVVPVLNEEKNLPLFIEAVSKVFSGKLRNYNWGVLFVDDGSRDSSWKIVKKLAEQHKNVRGIRLNRNYGSHLAISAGIEAAEGDAISVIAADLQDPPETLVDLVAKWRDGYKVVWAVRSARIEGFHRKLYSRLFHSLVRKYALPTYPSAGTGSFCLIDRDVALNVRDMPENFRTIFGLISIQGYRSAEVPYVRAERAHGESGWNFRKMLRTTIDVFTSYSHLPVRTIQWIGILSCVASAIAVSWQVATHFMYGDTLRGWTMLFATVCFFGGIQTLALGILGEYIWRTFHEVKHRPLWHVEDSTF